MTENVYYAETHVFGVENIPSDGEPIMIASNHQYSLNDALGILLAINDRKPNFIVRADVFAISKGFGKFLRAIGLLPAFRIGHEGSGAFAKNQDTFSMSEKALAEGETVVIFPEGGHAEGHWLNIFKSGMAKMAFEAAAMTDFEKDIQIVPACNHYSDYYGLRNRMLVQFGKPVSISQFYELYKTKPRTAQRRLLAFVRERIESMVLDEKDKEFYEELEFLRNGEFGTEFAVSQGFIPYDFKEKFESDKLLLARFLEARKAENPFLCILSSEEGQGIEELAKAQVDAQNGARESAGSAKSTGETESALLSVREYMKELSEAGITEHQISGNPSVFSTLMQSVALVLLLPLAVVCLWPSAICWLLPKFFANRAQGRMFEGTFVLAMNIVAIFPLLGILSFAVVWMKTSLLMALIYVLLFPLICLFEWKYVRTLRENIANWKWRRCCRKKKAAQLEQMRDKLFSRLSKIVGIGD